MKAMISAAAAAAASMPQRSLGKKNYLPDDPVHPLVDILHIPSEGCLACAAAACSAAVVARLGYSCRRGCMGSRAACLAGIVVAYSSRVEVGLLDLGAVDKPYQATVFDRAVAGSYDHARLVVGSFCSC